MSKVTVITGASSGIGFELALQLAPRGGTIYLLGQNPERIQAVAREVTATGADGRPVPCDLTDFEAMDGWYRKLRSEGVEVETFYHCAGRNTFGEIAECSMDDLEWIYRTNLLATVQWISLLFPDMARRRSGTIVLLSSLSAFTGFPMATPYAATKRALLALARSIWPEADEVGVNLHVAFPGFVQTRIFEVSRFRRCSLEGVINCIRNLGFPIIPAPEAARVLIKNVDRGKRVIIFPFYARIMVFFGFRFPSLVDLFHRRVIRILNADQSANPSPGDD